MTTNYVLANIRRLLLHGFSDRELRDLCIDVDQFRPVSYELSEFMGMSDIVARLLAFAVRRLLVEDLLIWAQAANPVMFAQHEPYRAPLRTAQPAVAFASRLPVKILFLAANPADTTRLRLDREARAIQEAIESAPLRSSFEFKSVGAVRMEDLQRNLMDYQPTIVHLSGHGNEDGLLLEDDSGHARTLPSSQLEEIFILLKDSIHLVVLNTCFSVEQANSIARHVEFVVGIPDEFADQSAILFSRSFFRALAHGRDIPNAFDLACLELGSTLPKPILAVRNGQ
jgi:hypothetical protein